MEARIKDSVSPAFDQMGSAADRFATTTEAAFSRADAANSQARDALGRFVKASSAASDQVVASVQSAAREQTRIVIFNSEKQVEAVQTAMQQRIALESNAEAVGRNLAISSARMREELKKETAAAALKRIEKESEDEAKAQAKAENEYMRVSNQADKAQAASQSARIDRAAEKEHAYHQIRLRELVGNDAAMEAEVRRHEATVGMLQADARVKGEAGMRAMLARAGSMGNQLQSLQMAFFGVGMAADGTDSKFGKMIGSVGLLASGAMASAQAYEVASAAMVGMGSSMMIALPLLAGVGVAFALLLEHKKRLDELGKKNDWLGDPAKYAAVIAAMKEHEATQKDVGKAVAENTNIYGMYAGMIDLQTKAMNQNSEANKKLLDITGKTHDELVAFYGDLNEVQAAHALLENSRMLSLQHDLAAAKIGQEKEGLAKSLELQELANKESERRIREHFAVVISDAKKPYIERKKAEDAQTAELVVQEKINQQLLQKVRSDYAHKQDKKDDSESKRQIDEYYKMYVASAKAADKALADMEVNKFNREIGNLNAELDATLLMYAEKKSAAQNNVIAIAALDAWLLNEETRIAYKATAAAEERDKFLIASHQAYVNSIAKMDEQAALGALSGDKFGQQQKQVEIDEIEANRNVAAQKLKWINEDGIAEAEADLRARTLIEKNHQASALKLKAIDKEMKIAVATSAVDIMGTLSSALERSAAKDKEHRLMWKAAAMAQTIASGALGAMKAWELGPIAGPIGAAAVAAATALNLETIREQKFIDGGFPSGRNARVVMNEDGQQESVLNARATASLGRENITQLNNTGSMNNNAAPISIVVQGSIFHLAGDAPKNFVEQLKEMDQISKLETISQFKQVLKQAGYYHA